MRRLTPFSLLGALLLAACSSTNPDGLGLPSSALFAPDLVQTSSATVGGTDGAIAAGERRSPFSTVRRTVLRGDGTLPGENFVSVETGGARGPRPGLLRPPAVEAIRAEMREVMPGVAMRIANLMERNGNGPFGYAAGSAGGTNCLYAWQWLDRRGSSGLLSRRDPASIRIRICRRASAGALLRAVRGMRFDAAGGGAVPSGFFAGENGDALAAAGGSLGLNLTAAAENDERPAAEAAPPPRMRRRAAEPARAAAPAFPEEPGYADAPTIPLPGGDASPSTPANAAPRSGTAVSDAGGYLPMIPDPDTAVPIR